MKLSSLVFLSLSDACTDVTSGMVGLNSWACRSCKRVRASFDASDYGLDEFDNTYTMVLTFPSEVSPRPNSFSSEL